MKKLAILGSTGSIGTQTLEVVRIQQDMKVLGLAANSNTELLLEQIKEFHPAVVAVWKEEKAAELKKGIQKLNTEITTESDKIVVEVVSGMEGLIQVATIAEVDVVVTAVVGMIGIKPTIAAIEAGKDIALANKETLVTAGHLIMPLAKEKGVSILPVDSEHSAIFQCLQGNTKQSIHKILLTASGGPFRGMTLQQLAEVEVEDALKHPNWEMGEKITIDSSTLINKGLEVIEAKWLFDVEVEDIQVVVQPKSIIHSMIEFEDGAIMAQLGTADMKLPIQYALNYPERRFLPGERLDFSRLTQILFEEPDMKTFKGLKLAYVAGKLGGSMPTVYNAANEKAVAKFLAKEIKYLDIADIVETCMKEHTVICNPTLEQILEVEESVYSIIESRW